MIVFHTYSHTDRSASISNTQMDLLAFQTGLDSLYTWRNLNYCPQVLREIDYVSLVRAIIGYGCTMCDSHLNGLNVLEKIQRMQPALK